jgi:hypothetical protein
LAIFNFGYFQFWQLSILSIFDFGNLTTKQLSILTILAILATSILATFKLGNLQFWQLSISKLSVLTIFNLRYFQAKFLNGSQEQHCMDLAIKKFPSAALKCLLSGAT